MKPAVYPNYCQEADELLYNRAVNGAEFRARGVRLFVRALGSFFDDGKGMYVLFSEGFPSTDFFPKTPPLFGIVLRHFLSLSGN